VLLLLLLLMALLLLLLLLCLRIGLELLRLHVIVGICVRVDDILVLVTWYM
jgi:hypothetical protein